MKKLILGIISILILTGCSTPSGLATSSHNCADKIAQAFSSNAKTTSGLWNCLDSSYQKVLIDGGNSPSDGLLGGNSPFDQYSFVGYVNGMDVYSLHVNPNDSQVKLAESAGLVVPPYVTLTVWVNPRNNRVLAYGVAFPQ